MKLTKKQYAILFNVFALIAIALGIYYFVSGILNVVTGGILVVTLLVIWYGIRLVRKLPEDIPQNIG